jgi:PAS domain S-box-containing protein
MISEGHLDNKIEIEGADEHTKLAESFNTMTAELQKHINNEQQARKEAEENLKRWEKLVDQDPSLIVIHINGEIKFINASGVEILGAESSKELIGKSVFDFLDEAQRNKATERIQEVQKKGQKPPPIVYKVNRLDGEERFLQVQGVPITYEGEKATQTVGIDITEHKTYEEQLQQSLEEKSVLLQEIHHRVKNNLAIISGLIRLQAMDSEDEKIKSQLENSQLRIQSMALIHELLYDTENFSRLNFNEHIIQLVDTIVDTLQPNGSVEIDYQLEEINLNINQAIPCGLLLNELVTNALKHAFKSMEKGIITIILVKEEGTLQLSVRDNGIGLPEDFDIDDAETLGMRIIKTLAKQLEASIDYRRKNGSKFIITFEIADVKGIGNAHMN